MSRIGREPIVIPEKVKVSVESGNFVTVTGPLGKLNKQLNGNIKIEEKEGKLVLTCPDVEFKPLYGLTRTLLNNMVVGVSTGYQKKLEINGVGYRAVKSGKTLTLDLGYSHNILFEEEDGLTFDVPNANTVVVKGIDKERVGQVAAEIRSKRPPEPYLGKGVKYDFETIRRKAGKAGK